MAKFEVPEGWTVQAYRFALDLTPSQKRAFRSHAGGARKAYNTMLALVKATMNQRAAERSYSIAEEDLTPALNWSLAGLRKEWNGRKDDTAPWWAENSKGLLGPGHPDQEAAVETVGQDEPEDRAHSRARRRRAPRRAAQGDHEAGAAPSGHRGGDAERLRDALGESQA